VRHTPTPASPTREVNADDRALALALVQGTRAGGGLLEQHLQRLRALPAHGNTKLHADQLLLGMLLSFFDPMARSAC
jgi:hypothetical protein